MSGAYRGGGNGNFRDDPMVLASLLRAMDYWNIRDFTVPQCLDYGGVAGICPCETPGFWNTNWYSNVSSTHLSCRFLLIMTQDHRPSPAFDANLLASRDRHSV